MSIIKCNECGYEDKNANYIKIKYCQVGEGIIACPCCNEGLMILLEKGEKV